jgi:hypothetical protein
VHYYISATKPESTTKKEKMKASAQSEELVPRSLREIVQKKFLDEVIGTTGN